MVGMVAHLRRHRGSRGNVWAREGWIKTRITFCKMDLRMGEGLGQKKKSPKFGRTKGPPDSLVSSKWQRLKGVRPRTEESGRRGHMSAGRKPCISAMKGVEEAGPVFINACQAVGLVALCLPQV